MKQIIIRDYDDKEIKAKIDAEIDEVQKRSKVRTISAYDVIEACKHLDQRFEIVPKKYRDGMAFDVDECIQPFPGAYKGIPESTHFCLTYKNGTWRLTDVYRGRCGKNCSRFYATAMPEAAQNAIVSSYMYFR